MTIEDRPIDEGIPVSPQAEGRPITFRAERVAQ